MSIDNGSNFVFIIGTHRSGSTFLRNALDAHSKITMLSDEPNILDPWHNDTFINYLNEIGDLNTNEKQLEFINKLKAGNIYSTFWKDLPSTGINFNSILDRINFSDKSPKSIFSIILDEYRKLSGKPLVGAKYPVHPIKLGLLLSWFPNSKYIFLIRNIYASTSSRLNDEATVRRKKKAGIFSFLVHYFTLVWFVVDFNLAAKAYNKYKNRTLFVKYEDMILKHRLIMQQICVHLNIDYEQKMSEASGKPSSYNGEIKNGVEPRRVDNWKKELNKFDYYLIKIFTLHSRKIFSY